MIIHFGLPAERLGPAALALGSFDGLHLGHRSVLEHLRAAARSQELQAAWVTLDPHPRCVLDPANCPAQITTLEERLRLVRSLGVHVLNGLNVERFTDETTHAEIKLSELTIGIAPCVVGPAIERKMGLSAFSQLAIDGGKWRTADWARRKGLFAELYPGIDAMDDLLQGTFGLREILMLRGEGLEANFEFVGLLQ